MKRSILLSIIFILLFCLYFMLKTNYEFSQYSVNGCGQVITVMIINKPFKREVAFIRGDYRENRLPSDKAFALMNLSSGLDAYFECVPSCINNKILINCQTGRDVNESSNNYIYLHGVSSSEYSFIKQQAASVIKIY